MCESFPFLISFNYINRHFYIHQFCHSLLTSVFTALLNAPSYFCNIREISYHGRKLPSRFASSETSKYNICRFFAGHQKEADFKILGATDGSFVFKQSCIILDFSLKTYLVNASNRKHSASLRLRPH